MSYNVRGLALGLGIGLASCSGGDQDAMLPRTEGKVSDNLESVVSDFSADRFSGKRVKVLYPSNSMPGSEVVPSSPSYVEGVVRSLQDAGASTSSSGVVSPSDGYRLFVNQVFGSEEPLFDYAVIADQQWANAFPDHEGLVYRTNRYVDGNFEFRRLYRSR